jgi:hypothetical protein
MSKFFHVSFVWVNEIKQPMQLRPIFDLAEDWAVYGVTSYIIYTREDVYTWQGRMMAVISQGDLFSSARLRTSSPLAVFSPNPSGIGLTRTELITREGFSLLCRLYHLLAYSINKLVATFCSGRGDGHGRRAHMFSTFIGTLCVKQQTNLHKLGALPRGSIPWGCCA